MYILKKKELYLPISFTRTSKGQLSGGNRNTGTPAPVSCKTRHRASPQLSKQGDNDPLRGHSVRWTLRTWLLSLDSEGTGRHRGRERPSLLSWEAGPRALASRLRGPVKSLSRASLRTINPTWALEQAYKMLMCLDTIRRTARSTTSEGDSTLRKRCERALWAWIIPFGQYLSHMGEIPFLKWAPPSPTSSIGTFNFLFFRNHFAKRKGLGAKESDNNGCDNNSW